MLRSVLSAVALALLASGRSAATEEIATVVESAPPLEAPAATATAPTESIEELEGIVIQGRMATPADHIKQRIAEAQQLLRPIPLEYTYLRRVRESLRGRPVLFAGWSEREQTWHLVEIEIPYPAPRWRPGGKPLQFRVLTPGYEASHVRGVGTERLMFDLFRHGERLQVLGRKYPIIDTAIARKRGIRMAVEVAEETLYLPMADAAAPMFVDQGLNLLRSTAEAALADLRRRKVPSFAYPEELLADTVMPETLMSLAVIEQTDDGEMAASGEAAFNMTIGHYGVMQTQAFVYSVSVARAIGPMQFTDRRGRGTYSRITKRCAGAELQPDFDIGARDLQNAMKAAACLLDLDLAALPVEVRNAYILRPRPASVFQVAAYNGGGRNASRLLRVVHSLKATVADLRVPDAGLLQTSTTRCPCLWLERNGTIEGKSIPRYNRENMGYVDKHMRFMSRMQVGAAASDQAAQR